jgi:nitroreductase
MKFNQLVEMTRSCRRFDQKDLPQDFLDSLIEIARICPSARNSQPLKYITIDDQDFMNRLFPNLLWAGALKDWDGPETNERPKAYIAMILDKSISGNAAWDSGIVAQTLQLYAMEQGIGSCILGSFDKKKIEELLELDDKQEIQFLIAFGYPLEKRVIVDVKEESDVKYYRDDNEVHYVPKRSVQSLLLKKI